MDLYLTLDCNLPVERVIKSWQQEFHHGLENGLPTTCHFIIPENMDFCQQYFLLYPEAHRNTRMRQLMLILLQKVLFKSLLIENNGLRFPSFREKRM